MADTVTGLPVELIDAHELARILGCRVLTVRRWMYAGVLPPPRRLNRTVRWVRSEIWQWILDGCPAGRAEKAPA